MLHSLVIAASDIAGKSPDKTAFYVMGGLLAFWAVVVSAIGISRHEEWPATARAAHGVMGISVVLVLGAMAAAVLSS
jgi:hypothetical protein